MFVMQALTLLKALYGKTLRGNIMLTDSIKSWEKMEKWSTWMLSAPPQTSPYVCGNLRKAWLQYADPPLLTSWSTWGSHVLGCIFKSWLQKEQKPPSTLDSCHFCVPNSTHPHQECGASHSCCHTVVGGGGRWDYILDKWPVYHRSNTGRASSLPSVVVEPRDSEMVII